MITKERKLELQSGMIGKVSYEGSKFLCGVIPGDVTVETLTVCYLWRKLCLVFRNRRTRNRALVSYHGIGSAYLAHYLALLSDSRAIWDFVYFSFFRFW